MNPASEIDLSSDQAMRPVVVDKESMSQEFHLTGLARASQVNDPAAGMRLKIELPRPWKGPAGRSLLDSSVQATAVGGDVSIGLELQSSQRLIMKALPDLGLPAAIETLDSGLESGFSRWSKDRGNAQAQTKPDHTADAIGGAVVSLEAGVIVELDISGKAQGAPVLAQCGDDFGSWDISIWP
jgi:hypothetical protein